MASITNPADSATQTTHGDAGPEVHRAAKEKSKRYALQRLEELEKQVQTLETSVLQVANYYIVFQGVVFTAIYGTPPSDYKCHFWYLPFSLSLTAAVLNLITLIVIAVRHQQAINLLEESEKTWRTAADLEVPAGKGWIKYSRITALICSVLLLAGFAGLNLYAVFKIPCYQIKH